MAKIQTSRLFRILNFRFRISNLEFRISGEGVTLLFVILILAAFLSISIEVFNTVFGELRVAGEISDSFVALYAADQGIEQLLYNDRVAGSYCQGQGSCTYGPATVNFTSGACTTIQLKRTGQNTTITSSGQYRCNAGELAVRRALQVQY